MKDTTDRKNRFFLDLLIKIRDIQFHTIFVFKSYEYIYFLVEF